METNRDNNGDGSENGATRRDQGTQKRMSTRWPSLLRRTLLTSTALAGILLFGVVPAFATTTLLYEYHPNTFSGFSWGYDYSSGNWGQSGELRFIPTIATTVDRYCMDITYTWADQQSGSTHFTMYPEFYQGPSWLPISSLFYDPFDWIKDLWGGSWVNILTGTATTSFDAYWTRSASDATTKSDPVCFNVSAALHHTMGLPTGYPVRLRVVMDSADKQDCARSLGNNSRCYFYFNSTYPFSSSSLGFQSTDSSGSTLNRNSVPAGELQGWSSSYIWTETGYQWITIPPASSSYGFADTDFGLFGNMIRDVVVWAFVPNEAEIPAFSNIASALSNRPPVGYWNLVKAQIDHPATSSDSTLAAVSTAVGGIFAPFKMGMGVLIYLSVLYYLYRRMTHIEL